MVILSIEEFSVLVEFLYFIIIGFCDNRANPRAKSSLRLSEDTVDSDLETLESQKLNTFSIKISSFWCFLFNYFHHEYNLEKSKKKHTKLIR